MFLSPASRQALLGLRVVAAAGVGRFQVVGDVARRAGLPANALAKVFQRLARRRLLVSQRGPGGGYALAKPADRVRLSDVLRAVQDLVPGGHHCLLGNRLCLEGELCLIHEQMIEADRLVIEKFDGLTLKHLAGSGGWA